MPIQTSGNSIRNISSIIWPAFARDEIVDPRPYCEIIRQFLSLHPEFSYLPRKFKIVVIGSAIDRAALEIHDVGLRLVYAPDGALGFEVYAGGGLGRTPILASGSAVSCRKRSCWPIWRPSCASTTGTDGATTFTRRASRSCCASWVRRSSRARWSGIRRQSRVRAAAAGRRGRAHARLLRATALRESRDVLEEGRSSGDAAFDAWLRYNTRAHRVPGYRVVFVSLKKYGEAPGDIDAATMDALADLADRESFGMLRATHDQNLVLADVPQRSLQAVWRVLDTLGLATRTSARSPT